MTKNFFGAFWRRQRIFLPITFIPFTLSLVIVPKVFEMHGFIYSVLIILLATLGIFIFITLPCMIIYEVMQRMSIKVRRCKT